MHVTETHLPGVLVIEPKVFGDERGFFVETFRASAYRELGLPPFVQQNQSRSRRGVLRGLHYQLTQPQGKLVRVARGTVFDVAVDIRRASPTFGQWYGCLLDDLSQRQLFVPANFAHGFAVISDEADFEYQCTDYYHPTSEQAIAWDDPEVGIEWPSLDISWTLSAKDAESPRLRHKAPELLPTYQP